MSWSVAMKDFRNTKVYLGLIATALMLMAWAMGCSGAPADVQANIGQEVSLSPGQTVVIQGEQLKIKFLEVVNDSRCPSGVECFWQGEANCLVEITLSGSTQQAVLTQPGLTSEPAEKDSQDYELKFNLEPYPEAGKTIARGDYRLHITVTR